MLQQINKENFQQMLGQFTTPELEGMIEKFPYFQQAHLLLAKKYQQENNPKFDQQLQLAALYIQDRELLYTLFNEKSGNLVSDTPVDFVKQNTPVIEKQDTVENLTVPTPEIITPVITKTEEKPEPVIEEAQHEETDIKLLLEEIEKSGKEISHYGETAEEEIKLAPQNEQVEEITAQSHKVEDTVEEQQAVETNLLQSEIALEETITEVTAEAIIEETTGPVAEEISLLPHLKPVEETTEQNFYVENEVQEQQVVETELLQSEIAFEETITEVTAEAIIEETAESVVEEISLTQQNQQVEKTTELSADAENTVEEQKAGAEIEEIITEVTATLIIEESDEHPLEETSLIEEKPTEQFSRIQPHTFDEWLKAFNNKSKAAPKTEEKPVVTEQETPDEKDELSELLATNISVDYLHELVKEETTYAKGLERFIEEQIQKHKVPEAKKRAVESDLNAELVTETMAKVYEMQKKYLKAIKTYEALTLKFPEKSSLFAARINYLKNIV